MEMSYRKVNYLELCWYILKAWMRHKHHPGKEKKCQENQNEAVPIQDVHDLPKDSTAKSTKNTKSINQTGR